jgi:hypothetical protein
VGRHAIFIILCTTGHFFLTTPENQLISGLFVSPPTKKIPPASLYINIGVTNNEDFKHGLLIMGISPTETETLGQKELV